MIFGYFIKCNNNKLSVDNFFIMNFRILFRSLRFELNIQLIKQKKEKASILHQGTKKVDIILTIFCRI